MLRARSDEALASSISDLGGLFHDILPADWLAETAADLRKRLFPRLRRAALMDFEQRLRQRILELRPGRHEPRAVKTRPKPYPYLTQPRHEFIA